MGCGASSPATQGAEQTEPSGKQREDSVKEEPSKPAAHVIAPEPPREPEPELLVPVLPDAPASIDDRPAEPVDGALAALASDALSTTCRDLEDILENVPHGSPVSSHIRAFFTRAQQVQHSIPLFLILAQQVRGVRVCVCVKGGGECWAGS
ncbi:hypothetical protein TSOC_003482 [Tetrabaena socialis]|uniref:Uncharacterized protein n=1 Tax=Tetrabaena socialis TaxID=47790 RepID=A0A2J8ABH1_9CHLO|nr:hypothetical protein TSOC_003482 [Tetrabaena socialis]|eukprot:PNH09871.1 hypothetical protein TSOC_003482 [Tetrabaena socialis]